MKNLTKIATTLCLAGISLAATAQTATPDVINGRMLKRVERRLGLNDAQKSQVAEILKTEAPVVQSLAVRMRAENAELMAKTTFDEPFVRGMAQKQAATRADVLVEREKLRLELLAVLTPEQREKVQQLRDRLGDRLGAITAGM